MNMSADPTKLVREHRLGPYMHLIAELCHSANTRMTEIQHERASTTYQLARWEMSCDNKLEE
jgi:hypothetical protein